MKNKIINKTKYIIIFSVVAFLLSLFCISLYLYVSPPKIVSIKLSDINENNKVIMTVEVNHFIKSKDIWCLLSKDNEKPSSNDVRWINSKNRICEFEIDAGNYNVFIKDNQENIVASDKKEVNIDVILSFMIEEEKLYLSTNNEYELKSELISIGNIDDTIKWETDNENVLTVENGLIKTISDGLVTVKGTTVNGLTDSVSVIVSSLIRKPVLNNDKKGVSCGQYTTEEAHLLDEILASRINNAGYASRGAVVAAARFLPLELPYKIPYFFENGRLNAYGEKRVVDGEGRYYHKGLFLSTDKYDSLVASFTGPGMWGCYITNYHTEYYFVSGRKYPNGLDCSGFVSWALYNAGFDPKDTGAGANDFRSDDLDDLGEKVTLDEALMTSGRVKVGDLIARDGHMAIVAGLDNENIYIAESLLPGVTIETFSIYEPSKLYNLYGYVMLMDSYYNNEGSYTNMW